MANTLKVSVSPVAQTSPDALSVTVTASGVNPKLAVNLPTFLQDLAKVLSEKGKVSFWDAMMLANDLRNMQ